jgi:hypothetical protein
MRSFEIRFYRHSVEIRNPEFRAFYATSKFIIAVTLACQQAEIKIYIS